MVKQQFAQPSFPMSGYSGFTNPNDMNDFISSPTDESYPAGFDAFRGPSFNGPYQSQYPYTYPQFTQDDLFTPSELPMSNPENIYFDTNSPLSTSPESSPQTPPLYFDEPQPRFQQQNFESLSPEPCALKLEPMSDDDAESDIFSLVKSDAYEDSARNTPATAPLKTDSAPLQPRKRSGQRQRLPHNVVERKYRDGLNNELGRLRKAVPTLGQSDFRTTKTAVLKEAIDYIKKIELERDEARQEIARLRDEMAQMANMRRPFPTTTRWEE